MNIFILSLFMLLGSPKFSILQNGYIEVIKEPQSTVDLHLAIAELREVAKELKILFLVPVGMDYDMWINMQETPSKKFNALINQLNWWIRCRINKCKSIPESY